MPLGKCLTIALPLAWPIPLFCKVFAVIGRVADKAIVTSMRDVLRHSADNFQNCIERSQRLRLRFLHDIQVCVSGQGGDDRRYGASISAPCIDGPFIAMPLKQLYGRTQGILIDVVLIMRQRILCRGIKHSLAFGNHQAFQGDFLGGCDLQPIRVRNRAACFPPCVPIRNLQLTLAVCFTISVDRAGRCDINVETWIFVGINDPNTTT